MKRFLLLLLILILPLFAAFTLDAGTVYYATDDELKAMVKARNLPEGSRSEMQDSLYKHENLTEYTEKLDSGSEYALEIVSADILSYESDTIVLEGNVTLSFSLSGSSSKTLNASSVIVDTERRFLTALDNVSFQDSDNNASLPKIEADIVTVFWDSGSLSITQATTSSDRKNSEDKSVTFYTTGSQLSFSEDG
ncbi:MAG: hypothetical protein SPJ34_03365, partial [Candidatus Ornithospirochaeta sp.]|nr:hypothetical protein [Candidatus Ornithospirochaeta sp.]